MKKVLHIFGIMNRGGAELRTLSTIDPMKKNDVHYDFMVLSGQKGVLDEQIKSSGSMIHYCKLGPRFIFDYVKVLRTNDYNVVHSHVSLVSGVMLFLAYLCGVKTRVAHFRSTHDVESAGIARRIRDVILRSLLKVFATHIAGVSKATLDAFWLTEWRKNPKFHLIYNGFPSVKFESTDNFWQKHAGVEQAGPWVVNVARMHEQKNHPFLIEVFCELKRINPGAKLALIGKEDSQIKAELESILKANKVDSGIYFLGEQSDVLSFMLSADLMLFPSKWEGLPGAVLESARAGLPVLGSDIPPIIEIEQKLTSVSSFPLAKSAKEWAVHINELLELKPDNIAYQHEFKLSEFQLENNVRQLLKLYN